MSSEPRTPMPWPKAVAITAVVTAVVAVIMFGAPAAFATETNVTSTATVKDSPDDGCPVWARDTFTRTTTITKVVETQADIASKKAPTYKVVIKDSGTFITKVGSKTPGDSTLTIGTAVTGSLEGTGEFTVVGWLKDADDLDDLNGDTYDNSGYACKSDVPEAKTTGKWPLKFFKYGATTSGINPWKWTYKTACETRVESSTAEPVGNITGKVCPSASPSASKSATASPSPSNSTSATAVVTPSTSATPSLPVTGSAAGTAALVGLGLLVVGAAGIAISRWRRRGETVFVAE